MVNYGSSRHPKLLITIAFIALQFLAPSVHSQPTLIFTPAIATGLTSPIDLVHAGDGTKRIFVVQQGGTIRVYDQQLALLGNFLTVTGISTGSERGLLSMVFSPSYATNGFFYVYYTNTSGDLELARYHVSADPNVADVASKVVVLTIPHPTNSNHNGGKLLFGDDGFLYFATGDGGGGGDQPNNAQNGNSLLGKMIRISVNNSATAPFYTIPANNPFVNDPNIRDEIWALGLRNPFRWSFDRATHDMWIGDVGQDAFEEIDFRPAGSTGGINYGWRCYEGTAAYNTSGCGPASNYVTPVFAYANPAPGSAAVTGGVVYRGSLYPALQGYYFAADVYSATVYLLRSNGAGGWINSSQNGLPGTIVCFGEDEDGEVYAVSLTGTIYKISTNAAPPATQLLSFTAVYIAQVVQVAWQTASEQNLQQFELEYSNDQLNFQTAGTVAATNSPNGHSYQIDHALALSGTRYYRLKIISIGGSFEYSDVISVDPAQQRALFIYPSFISNGTLSLHLDQNFETLELVSIHGARVLRLNISGQNGRVDIPVGRIASGVYVARIISNRTVMSQKIVLRN